jgi:heat shock protein HslJ
MRSPFAIAFVFMLAACTVEPPPAPPEVAAPAPTPASPLAGTRWQLAELRAPGQGPAVIRIGNPSRYMLHFEAPDQVAVRLDCNSGRGGFTTTPTAEDRGALAFGPIAMTRMLCPRGSQETRVARELAMVRSYGLGAAELRLDLGTDGAQQVWRRAGR